MARAKFCLLLCVVWVRIFAQPAGRGAISGTVIEASSGDGVRKAIVTLTWHGTPRAWATTRTDASGRFTFEGLPAGKYDLRANRQMLGGAVYGADSVRDLGDELTLGEGEVHGDVKLRFLRSGSISGRVIDQDGEPTATVSVSLLRPGRNFGERVLLNYQQAMTNDRGEYKFSVVDPGAYYLLCSPNNQRGMVLSQDFAVPQYYGGGRDSKDAAPVNLRGGEALAGFDFHLTAEHPAKITGRVTGVPAMDPPAERPIQEFSGRAPRGGGGQNVTIELNPADESQNSPGTGVGAQPPDYHFELPEVVSGRYRMQATIRVKDKTYSASQIIDAHEGINDTVLSLAPAVELKGHLKVEGPAAHPLEGFTIMLNPPGSGQRGASYSSSVKKDGSFAIPDVPPGEWLLNVNPNPGGMFDKSVRLGDKDFLFQRLEIPPGSDAPLNIVLSSNSATVTGEVDAGGSDTGSTVKRAGILLEPVGKLHTFTRFYYSALAGDDGKFKLTGVAPGKYKIFALQKIAATNYRNPESGDLLDALGEELDVTEGAKIEFHPKLIPEEKAKEILKP
jgi:hypothetical protein